MAHSLTPTLGAKPEFFNFGRDVIDYWASQSPVPQAMYHLNQDQSKKRILDYTHFARESRRISVFLERLGVKRGEVVLLILPRVVEW
jgi:medium-chain acyl-CoA synthetase